MIPNTGAAWVLDRVGYARAAFVVGTHCAASQDGDRDGLDAIRLGRAEVMLCGGTDAAITRTGIAGSRRCAPFPAATMIRGEKVGRSTPTATGS